MPGKNATLYDAELKGSTSIRSHSTKFRNRVRHGLSRLLMAMLILTGVLLFIISIAASYG